MLNIYYGRENLNKEKFMFDEIKRTAGKILLLVPDQFTLQAEKEAFHYLETRGIMELEILSFSRLGARILKETGFGAAARIDELGRYMLITKLAAQNKDRLKLFKNTGRLVSFSRMANDLIYEMKQYNTVPSDLIAAAGSINDDLILKQKLEDIHLLYSQYEEYTKEKYLDGEDYIGLFTSKAGESALVKDSVIWIYGFDYFTPKNMELLNELMKHAREMNVLMTYEDGGSDGGAFDLTGGVIAGLKRIAARSGAPGRAVPVSESYKKAAADKRESLAAVEREFFSITPKPCADCGGVTIVKAANLYGEIESAAAFVLSLVRDYGLKYKDIAIICNDTEERGSIAKRVFSEYGADIFIDQKRSFMHNAAVRFMLSLLNIVISGYRSADIFSMLKTGMTDISAGMYEELENYSVKYRIKGGRWKKEFSKGVSEYGEDFTGLEESRRNLAEFIAAFEKPFVKAKTVRQRVETLYNFLSETAGMPEKLEKAAAAEAEAGFHEFAEETAQAWKKIVSIFDQLVEIMGDEEISAGDFADIFSVGLEAVEVGVLPPAADGLILGTMQRTRVGRIKALLIIGANEGVLPAAAAVEGLLSGDEKNRLFDINIEICRREEFRLREEQLAIYKNISKPESFLWMSCSISDLEGGRLSPSVIFDKLRELFPRLEVRKDVISEKNPASLIQSRGGTLAHMTNALRESLLYEKQPAREWECTAKWYRNNEKRYYNLMTDGLFFNNAKNGLAGKSVEGLYKKGRNVMALSPSRLEKYARCPFAFFMTYGLRPDEMRVFEVAGREIGEIYHNCIMRFSKELTGRGKKITDAGSRWMEITREESDELIGTLIDGEAGVYREGILSQGCEEAYRASRLKEVCRENAWVLVSHVRRGDIERMGFEEKFGRAADGLGENDMCKDARIKGLPPIEVEMSSGKKAIIEGKIDRVDILADGSVKIIDYKSGSEKFNIAEARAGWQLQLMLYLKAAQGRLAEPAGVFYFTIDEKAESGRMDGVLVDKASVIEGIAGAFERYSDVIPVRKLKDGTFRGNSEGNLLSEDEFRELQGAVDKKVRALCDELISGRIDARPKRSGGMTACTYCGYKSVCTFDTDFDGCAYENI